MKLDSLVNINPIKSSLLRVVVYCLIANNIKRFIYKQNILSKSINYIEM